MITSGAVPAPLPAHIGVSHPASDVELPGSARPPPSDEALSESQAGQVGSAAAAGLVPDAIQVRADRADADV